MVDFGSGQGRSEIETAGVLALRRGFQSSENAGLGRKMPFLDGHYPKQYTQTRSTGSHPTWILSGIIQ